MFEDYLFRLMGTIIQKQIWEFKDNIQLYIAFGKLCYSIIEGSVSKALQIYEQETQNIPTFQKKTCQNAKDIFLTFLNDPSELNKQNLHLVSLTFSNELLSTLKLSKNLGIWYLHFINSINIPVNPTLTEKKEFFNKMVMYCTQKANCYNYLYNQFNSLYDKSKINSISPLNLNYLSIKFCKDLDYEIAFEAIAMLSYLNNNNEKLAYIENMRLVVLKESNYKSFCTIFNDEIRKLASI